MEDRFKFRAWDVETNQMMHLGCMMFQRVPNQQVQYYEIGPASGLVEAGKQDNLTLMQCTGLKDKNGKLIYEGDIVRWPWERVRMGDDGLESYMDVTDWKVEWRKGGWFPFLDAERETFAACDPPSTCEVIGNIYENPDLLKPEGEG